jgi:hypothetical protein
MHRSSILCGRETGDDAGIYFMCDYVGLPADLVGPVSI